MEKLPFPIKDIVHEICNHIPPYCVHDFFHLMWTCKRLFKWVDAYPFRVKWRAVLLYEWYPLGNGNSCQCTLFFDIHHRIREPTGTFITLPGSECFWELRVNRAEDASGWQLKIKKGSIEIVKMVGHDTLRRWLSTNQKRAIYCQLKLPNTPQSLWHTFYKSPPLSFPCHSS